MPGCLIRRNARFWDALSRFGQPPSGKLTGHIKSITAPHGKPRAQISLAFETIAADGKTYPITADLKEIVANSKGVKQVDEEGQVIGVRLAAVVPESG